MLQLAVTVAVALIDSRLVCPVADFGVEATAEIPLVG